MPDIFVVDDQHPEDLAMLQALYSRSPASVLTHLEKLKLSGSGKFMDQYYVGYGHASIGDCGATTIFVEQVSMLVAKAIQDNPLYNGQEASTRYLDFSKQAVVDPYATEASKAIQSKWIEIYNRALPLLIEGLKKRYPFDSAQYKTEKIWQNALYARAFDVARSLLPIGTTTLLSWTTSLRAARDHVRRLKHHPLPEIRDAAHRIFDGLIAKYPHSFKAADIELPGNPIDAYCSKIAPRNAFVSVEDIAARFALTSAEKEKLGAGAIVARPQSIDLAALRKNEMEVLSSRPRYAALPWRLESYGKYNYVFLLDFGSFRDLQRHRNGVCQIPLIDGRFGFNPWYLSQFEENMPSDAAAALKEDIAAQFKAIADLQKEVPGATPALSQYYFPMGTQALVHASYSVSETVYIGELRSAKTVHPSLRPIAQKMLAILERDIPGMALYGDHDEDSWSAKRGEQTIKEKEGSKGGAA
ncbi:MAG: FAD-dependent thymidylate synthase [Alphaproteobacteria bacterium]|nr:FAD-dependent thymidylate synthase [Alphaproteobacteria bacterium]